MWVFSTGQDVVVRFAVKPTSSILTPRASIDRFGAEVEIVTKGRHDPCVGIRAVPVGEAMMACVLLDHLMRHEAQCGPLGSGQRSVVGSEEASAVAPHPPAPPNSAPAAWPSQNSPLPIYGLLTAKQSKEKRIRKSLMPIKKWVSQRDK